jgi:hypothetical protein
VAAPATPMHAKRSAVRPYRIALIVSLVANVLLITGFWLYLHYAGTISMIQDVIGIFE